MRQRTDLVRWVFVALLVVSVAQVAWWMLDQWWFTNEVSERTTTLYEGRRDLAAALLDRGLDAAEVESLVPGVDFVDGRFEITDGLVEALAEERRSRLNRYLWEGVFFLGVLLAALTVIAGVLRQDARLRRRQQNFLAAVSHEFKSPLAAARLAAETLQMRKPDPEAQEVQIGRLLRSLRRLDSMVDNLLDSARIEAGAVQLRPSSLQVVSTLTPVITAYESMASDRGVQFELVAPDSAVAYADQIALTTVVRNLLENAFRAVEAEPDPRVALVVEPVEGALRISVRDNGVGFEPGKMPALFEKFYRPGDEMRRSGRGAGLGLYIVRALMEESGGAVTAESAGVGQGAEFSTRWLTEAPA